MIPFVILASLVIFGLSGWLALSMVRRQRDRLPTVIPGGVLASANGLTPVPIVAAMISGSGLFGAMAKNSINPSLDLTPDGLAFKVLGRDQWTYAQLTRVHAAKGLFGPTVDFRSARASLCVTVPDLETARQALAALPRSVPLSKQATALRDAGRF